MSRRRERARKGAAGQGAAGREADASGREAGAAGREAGAGLRRQIALLVAVFAVVTLIAELAGAANLGVALGIGQVAFAIATVYLLVRG